MCLRIAILTGLLVALPSFIAAEESGEPRAKVKNSIGMELTPIPAGKFIMGSPEDQRPKAIDHPEEEGPQHEVEIARPFYLGVYEVTQAQYEKVMDANPSWHTREGAFALNPFTRPKSTEDYPVEKVTWHEAVAFCDKLSELPDEKRAGRKYRLPTEAEWEYACRAGTTTRFSFGDACNCTEAQCDGRVPVNTKKKGPEPWFTAKVGKYKPNAWGLYDMHGNVAEWCSDWYALDYYSHSPKQDPTGPEEGTQKILRGGAYLSFPSIFVGSANRQSREPDEKGMDAGFRVVMAVEK